MEEDPERLIAKYSRVLLCSSIEDPYEAKVTFWLLQT